MKEFLAIVAELEKAEQAGEAIALATVVEVRGSTYRRPGARMLVTPDGRRIGTISGGCLEADVVERSQSVMESGEPVVVTYDTTSADDIVWGLGLGCNGIVRVLIEPLTPQHQSNYSAFLSHCCRQRQIGVLATVVSVVGQLQVQVGTRLMLSPDGSVVSNLPNSALAGSILDAARAALHHNRSTLQLYQLPLGQAEVFIEVIQPPVPLVIFGAGDDAIPVVRFAQELGWHVTVVDSRQTDATKERFAAADAIALVRPENIAAEIVLDSNTVAVVMTHNYLHDQEILQTLLPSSLRYIGILGPKGRTERLLADLRQQGCIPTAAQLERLYGPVGIDIGADTPEAIALAIVAEIQAAIANRSGGFLRERQGPIHNRDEALIPVNPSDLVSLAPES